MKLTRPLIKLREVKMHDSAKFSELEEYKERLSFVTEWLQHPIIELDSTLKIIYLNKSAELQFPDIKALGIRHPVIKGLEMMASEFLQGNSEIIIFEREVQTRGLIYEQQIFAIPKKKYLYIFMTDSTKRKEAELARQQAEAQLYQAQKMEAIGKLSGGIAHDFNNILMIIQGNLQLLQSEIDRGGTENKRVKVALEAVGRGSALSKRLLAFARREDLQPALIIFKEFIDDLLKLLNPALGSSIELNIAIQDGIGKIMVDRNQLENAILNLAFNASHAMEGKGKINIDVSHVTYTENLNTANNIEPGDYIKISITDTGSGISPENLPHIFEPFFTTKEKGKGTGLGLSMVYAFVVQSRGYITIDSQLQKGTTINMIFPRVSAEKNSETIDIVNKITNLEKLKHDKVILIVDDEKELRELLASYLKELGYIILQAENGDAALSVLKNTLNVDLLLSDIAMPGSYNGLELADEVQRLYPKTKILLSSGHINQAASEQSKYQILTKPYNLPGLAIELQKILEAK